MVASQSKMLIRIPIRTICRAEFTGCVTWAALRLISFCHTHCGHFFFLLGTQNGQKVGHPLKVGIQKVCHPKICREVVNRPWFGGIADRRVQESERSNPQCICPRMKYGGPPIVLPPHAVHPIDMGMQLRIWNSEDWCGEAVLVLWCSVMREILGCWLSSLEIL